MRFILIVSLVSSLMLLAGLAEADEYAGWDAIRAALSDGDGAEFVRPLLGLGDNEFSATTELDAVKSAATWVAANMEYVEDVGEVWTSSDQTYTKDIDGDGKIEGDCEDYAILLCALLRFHTQGGIPASRVWVSVNLVTEPGIGVVTGHAWVGYKLEHGGMVHIEPQTGTLYRGRPRGKLNFNDEWVRGGGFWLHGPAPRYLITGETTRPAIWGMVKALFKNE